MEGRWNKLSSIFTSSLPVISLLPPLFLLTYPHIFFSLFVTPHHPFRCHPTWCRDTYKCTRTNNTFECATLKGLYPTGEGAGYAGGIVVSCVMTDVYDILHFSRYMYD